MGLLLLQLLKTHPLLLLLLLLGLHRLLLLPLLLGLHPLLSCLSFLVMLGLLLLPDPLHLGLLLCLVIGMPGVAAL